MPDVTLIIGELVTVTLPILVIIDPLFAPVLIFIVVTLLAGGVPVLLVVLLVVRFTDDVELEAA